MTKRKHSSSVVDLTTSPPLPSPLTSHAPDPSADPISSTRSSRSKSSRSHLKRRRVDALPSPDGSQQPVDVDVDVYDKTEVESLAPTPGPSNPRPVRTSSPPASHLLAAHTCPICFSGVTNACLTPCGHVLCGACLFAAVRSGIQRSLSMGMVVGGEATAAKCPVCRAVLKGWDGKGGGVIPLKIRTILAL